MSKQKNQKLYEYFYELKDRWGDVVESSSGEVVADDMRDAVDVAYSFIQLKYFRIYDYPMDIDIYEIKVQN